MFGGTTKLAWPLPFSSGSTLATTTWTSAMPPLVIHALVPLIVHSSLASSYTARVRRFDTSEPASGSLTQNAPSLHVVGRAVALRHPFDDLLGRAVAGDSGRGEPGAHDRHADAGVTPEDLLDGDRQRESGRVGHRVHDEVDAVQADLGGLLDDRPRELLALVPLVGGGPDDVLGEVVTPLLQLQLVFVEIQREVGHEP